MRTVAKEQSQNHVYYRVNLTKGQGLTEILG